MSQKCQTFTISLRIVGQDIKLNISVDQSLNDVFQKLKLIYPNSVNKKTEILDKLIDTLKIQLQMKKINTNLLHSIQLFLERNNFSKKIQNFPELISKTVSLCQSKTIEQERPTNKRFQDDKQNVQNSKFTIKKMQLYSEQSAHLQKRDKNHISNQKKQKNPLKTNNRMKSVINQTFKKTKFNPDLIKACQIIMKKVQNTEMKLMAKQFLREKGYLKQEKQKPMSHNRKKLSTQITNNLQAEEHYIKTQSSIPNAKKQNSKTIYINSTLTDANVNRQKARLSKYRYLQSSLINDSLNKQYSLSKQYEPSPLIKTKDNQFKPKKYSYLQ